MLRRSEQHVKRMAIGLGRIMVRSRANAPFDPAQVQRILIIRQHNQLGDMLCVVPLLRALRLRYPAATLTLLTSPVNCSVMQHHRLLHDVINYDKRVFLGHARVRLGKLLRFIRNLRDRRFDLAIVPATVSVSLTSDLLAYFSGARWRVGAGSLEGRENPGGFLYTHPVPLAWAGTPERHQTLRNIDVCQPLGLGLPPLDLEITLLPDEIERGRSEVMAWKSGARAVVAVHAGAGKPPNRWPAELFSRLMTKLHETEKCQFMIVCGPMDREPVESLVNTLNIPYYLIENRPIRDVASILKSVNLLITNDTGIMHVGAAAGVPVLSLFGPTDPRQWAPMGRQNRYICSESGAMGDIPLASVLNAARDMLPEHGECV
jgi:ADP-heptose:LPS heptosyltransferase